MLTFTKVKSKYSKARPKGLPAEHVHSCAARLSYAIYCADESFFKDVTAKGGTGAEWKGLPLRASDLAIILNKKIKKPVLVKAAADISGTKKKHGIIFFDTIPGFAGTGHISLWDGTKVLDDGNYFGKSPRVYFWTLP